MSQTGNQLWNLAIESFEAGRTAQGLTEMTQAAQAYVVEKSLPSLAAALAALSVHDQPNRLALAAQGAWVSLQDPQFPASDFRDQFENLFAATGDGYAELRRGIATRLMWLALPGRPLCADPTAGLQATEAMRVVAAAEGVETQQDFDVWLNALLQTDFDAVNQLLIEEIEKIASGTWRFDREAIKA